MIKIKNIEVLGWEHAIRGMRNPMNSWEKSDSAAMNTELYTCCDVCPAVNMTDCRDACNSQIYIGPNDFDLMLRLVKSGTDHAKFRRMITVYVDLTAPLYWWKEFDTYKVGTVANSCSTMHKIAEKEFTLDDFSHEHLFNSYGDPSMNLNYVGGYPTGILRDIINALNTFRGWYLETNDKKYWWQMIQLLPSSYNQKRTVMLNYEVLANIYKSRKDHKLDEWREFCAWIETLPYSEIIAGKEKEKC